MAKDRRDRDEEALALQLGLQELEVEPEPRALEVGGPALEERMMFAVEMLQTLPEREQLAVVGALLPQLLESLDVSGRSAFIDELVARSAMRPLA